MVFYQLSTTKCPSCKINPSQEAKKTDLSNTLEEQEEEAYIPFRILTAK